MGFSIADADVQRSGSAVGNAHDSCRMQVTSQVAQSASSDCK